MSDIKIKGPSLKYIVEFLKERYPGKFETWFEQLPEKSQAIYSKIILASEWFDINDGHVIPITTLGKVLFEGDTFKAAYEMGKFGGKKALTGIYKIFIKIPSIDFIMKRVANITATYYSGNIKILVLENSASKISIKINGFYEGQELMFPNIAGWLDNLMSIVLKKPYEIEYKSNLLPNGQIEGFIDTTF